MNQVRSEDGASIAFDRSGDGPPLVVVAGAFCDRNSKKSLAAGLGAAFTVYEYDRRGRGDSGGSCADAVEREVEDLAAVIDAAGGEAFVFGDSSGGALAIEAAAAGVAVRKLAVYEVPYTAGPTSEFADHLDELVSEGRPGDAAEAFLTLMGTPPGAIAGMKAGPYWPHMEACAPTLAQDVRLCNDGKVPTERLQGIRAPVLALAGGASPWAGDVAGAIAAAAPHARAGVLEGQGHAAADDVLIPVLVDFFD
jgi:pimeloyl-ACP methyl ester carboxylesterase